ncbi:ProQ/FINO family protein [Halomonas sp. 18H]|uniref:ProQ/FINO family protein n=1 Tax=Halomonas almeriensis TaxID=308163 RepID=UPI0022303155|nr:MULTISPECIES: ProQ/FINO family protein [Halomonas]MCW4149495.1 ProQ/FINO family protein [Halomonas sp. 18H]MDN3553559.1 ProQ/FINO family protein [Halomonas almeriensis]
MEDQELIEESSTRLIVALEDRAEALLAAWDESRARRESLSARLDDLAQHCQALEARNAELTAEARERADERDSLAQQLSELQHRLADAEASGMELLEENRELDEQNREIEAHNRQLREARETSGDREAGLVFQRRGRRAQGFSALMGQRPASQRQSQDAPTDLDEPEVIPGERQAPAGQGEEASAHSQASVPPIDEAPSPQALLEQWYQRYPKAFFKGHTRPLQVGIHESLTALEPWPEKLVRRALACYVNLPRYLKSVREGAERIDLEGAVSGHVDAGAAEHARKKVDRLQSARRSASKASGHNGAKRTGRRGKGKPADGEPGEAPSQRPASVGPTSADADRSAVPASGAAPSAAPGNSADQSQEPQDRRMQRKLSELMARHNPD